MKAKKLLSGLLTCAIVVTSVFNGGLAAEVKAAEASTLPTAIESYDFNAQTLSDNSVSGNEATMMKLKHGDGVYTGSATYVDGRNGGYALALGNHGLELNSGEMDEWTYSMWVKPTTGFKEWSPYCLLGGFSSGIANQDGQQWIGLHGNNTTELRVRYVENGGKGTIDCAKPAPVKFDEWNHIVFTQNGSDLDVYLNGSCVYSASDAPAFLDAEADLILVGTNYWGDPAPKGAVDDIAVYDEAVSAIQVLELYSGQTIDEWFADETTTAFTVSDDFSMYDNEKKTISVNVDTLIKDAATVSFATEDTDVVTVDETTGEVTPVAAGKATITVTVKFGDATKTADVVVTVDATRTELTKIEAYDFNYKSLKDSVSGNTAKEIGLSLADTDEKASYATGRSGEKGDYAVDLRGEYGLLLNSKGVGEDWALSYWMNASYIAGNGAVGFVGYNDPEEWLAISGKWASAGVESTGYRFWLKANGAYDDNTDLTSKLTKNAWHHVVYSQKGSDLDVYVDGENVYSSNSAASFLDAETDKVILGSTYFGDILFNGYIDDVAVYSHDLTAAEVEDVYAETYEFDAAERLANTEISATDKLDLVVGNTGTIDVTVDADVADDVDIEFESADDEVATVSDNGVVTAVGAGRVAVTTTVTAGDVEKTATTNVLVTEKELTPEEWFIENGFSVAAPSIELVAEETGAIEVVLNDKIKDHATVSYNSLNEEVVTVDKDGALTAVAEGKTTVKVSVTVGETTKEFNVIVEVAAKPVVGIVEAYDFNAQSLADSVNADAKATVIGIANASSSATPTYVTGRSGEEGDHAVKLGSHGLRLNSKAIGENWSLSLWMQPTAATIDNGAGVIAGNSNPEQWVAVAGAGKGTTWKLWANDKATNKYNWSGLNGDVGMVTNDWNHIVYSQNGAELSVYVNGKSVYTTEDAPAIMDGANDIILVGATHWTDDGLFTGYVDDIEVRNESVTAKEVGEMYTGETPESYFEQNGFTASESIEMLEGKTSKIKVNLADMLVEDAKVSYESEDDEVATVAEDGTVTAVAVGETTVTVTVTVGNVTKTAEVAVKVNSAENVNKDVAAEYDMTQSVNGQLVDISGRGNNATIKGSNYNFDDGYLTIDGQNSYVELPLSIMDSLSNKEEFTIEATYAKSKNSGENAWLFTLGSNPKSTGTNYLFFCPYFHGSGGNMRAGIKDNSAEQLFSTNIINKDEQFYTVNLVFDNGTLKLYVDGVKVGGQLDTGYSIMDDVVTPGSKNNVLGYIGKSNWSADQYFEGSVSSFKIYDKAMTDEEVQSAPIFKEKLEANLQAAIDGTNWLGMNESAEEVRYNLSLPVTCQETEILWTSSDESTVSNNGIVTNGSEDKEVTLTGTVTSGALSASVELNVIVKALDLSVLDAKLEEAQGYVTDDGFTEASRAELQRAIDKINKDTIKTQTDVLNVVALVDKAITKLDVIEIYVNPFTEIDADKLSTTQVLGVNKTVQLFQVPDEIKDLVTVSYSSSDESVVTYADGVITSKTKPGYAVVTTAVTSNYDGFVMYYETLVYVNMDMSSVSVKAGADALAVGGKTSVTVSYGDAVKVAGAVVSYSARGAVAVDKSGNITAKRSGEGTVFVKVTAAGKSVRKAVTINVGEITGPSTVKVKKSITLKVKGLPGKVTWKVNNKKIATISSKGKLKAKKAGTVKVTATIGNIKLTKKIKVTKK